MNSIMLHNEVSVFILVAFRKCWYYIMCKWVVLPVF